MAIAKLEGIREKLVVCAKKNPEVRRPIYLLVFTAHTMHNNCVYNRQRKEALRELFEGTAKEESDCSRYLPYQCLEFTCFLFIRTRCL